VALSRFEPVTFGPISPDLGHCHFSLPAASVDGGEEVVTMGFIIVTAVIVGAALLAWRFIFSPQAMEGSDRHQRRR
jgi:hypothetical protein